MILGVERLCDRLRGFLQTGRVTAREDVNGGVPMLRPCMDADMGFSDDDDAGDALGAELVKRVSYDGCADTIGGIYQCRFNGS